MYKVVPQPRHTRTLVLKDGAPYVAVAPSETIRIPGEKGLFAMRRFRCGDTIGFYTGKTVPHGTTGPYVFRMRSSHIGGGTVYIDGRRQGPPFVNMINDARGTASSNNARLAQSGRVVATRTIDRGQEILMSYGASYWARAR